MSFLYLDSGLAFLLFGDCSGASYVSGVPAFQVVQVEREEEHK